MTEQWEYLVWNPCDEYGNEVGLYTNEAWYWCSIHKLGDEGWELIMAYSPKKLIFKRKKCQKLQN